MKPGEIEKKGEPNKGRASWPNRRMIGWLNPIEDDYMAWIKARNTQDRQDREKGELSRAKSSCWHKST